MNITSPQFLVFAIAVIVIFHVSKARPYRGAVLFAANVFFVASFIKEWVEIVPLSLILIYGYLLVLYAYKENRTKVIYAGILLLIAVFIYIKGYPITRSMPKLPFNYVVVGLSYMLFRMIHLALDVSSRAYEEKITFVSYFNYVCSFLTFTSGPIQRYQDFAEQEAAGDLKTIQNADMTAIFSRIASGYFKVSILSAVFLQAHKGILPKLFSADISGGPVTIILFAVCAAAYTLYLYFNFSGYMDIVIGIGKIIGFNLPENFRGPFGAGNFLEFWSKWHITLSEWFKIYMFNPLLKVMVYRWGSPKVLPYLGVAVYFATFVTLGAWHGTIYVGLFLGLGVSINKLYEVEVTRRFGRNTYRKMKQMPVLRYLNRGLVFGYISLSITCLWADIGRFIHLMKNMGIAETAVSVIALSAAASIFYFFAGLVMKLYCLATGKFAGVIDTWLFRQLWLAAKILVVAALLLSKAASTPEIAYKVF